MCRRSRVRRRAATVAGVMLAAGSLVAPARAGQAPGVPQGSLVVDPQQGATPRPLPPSPPLPPAPTPPPPPAFPAPAPIPASGMATPPTPASRPSAPDTSPSPQPGPWSQAIPGGLPAPTGDPLHIDPATDPILQLARAESSSSAFRTAIGEAVARNPSLDEAVAQVDEAAAARAEASARRLPMADLSLSTFQVISRAFSNDIDNFLERSRPLHRTDGLARIQQPLFDFGAGLNRLRAARARVEAAQASVEDTGTQIALRAISAWYTVYGYRALVRLGDAFAASQRSLRASVEDRIRQGAAAQGDVAQVDSYIASSDAQLADFRRQLAGAEAQYAAAIGAAPPPGLGRAPAPALDGVATATLGADTDGLPAVRAARLGVDAAQAEARASRSDRWPQLSGAIDAGRYGVIETERDYDVRGSVTLSWRLGGGAQQRAEQAEARANGADARLRRTRVEARRDAEIALADVAALEQARAAIESNYLASRQSRDVLAERFRVSRGTVFDLLAAESNYFGVAARYIQTVIELDTARYALLARTGRLLPALGIAPAALEPR